MKKFLSLLLSAVMAVIGCFAAVTIGYVLVTSRAEWENTEPAELTDAGSPYKFYYAKLDNTEKHAYNEILSEIYSMPQTVEIPQITAEQLDRVFSALLYDNPDLFFVGRKCTISTKWLRTFCTIEYIIDKEEYPEAKSALDQAAEKVISGLSKPDDEWQTELEIHDYIIDNCEYKLVESELVYSSAYGALVNGSAACEGYSKAAKLLFDRAGIESAVLSGTSENFDGTRGAHMWNAVKIDGDFYYLDCTWDDPLNDSGANIKIYSYFNINNDMIAGSHSDFSYDFNCTQTKANYYVKTGRYFESYDRSDEKRLAALLADALNSGEDTVQIRFGNESAYNGAVADLVDSGRIYNVLLAAKKKTMVDLSTDSLVYYKDPGQLMLTFVPEKN